MRLFCRCPTPSESCRLVLSTQQKFLAASQFLVLRRGEEKTFALNTRSSQGTVSFNFSSVIICNEEETEEISADDFVIHGGFNIPAQHWSLVSIQG